jgi:hypothetical protein
MGGMNGTGTGPGRIVVAGSVAQKPWHGGHTWVFLQYALGLKRLGWEVLLLDRLAPTMCADEGGHACPAEESWNLRYAGRVMQRFGLEREYAVILEDEDGGPRGTHGLERGEILDRIRGAELLLNVMGFLDDEELLGAARRRVFLDIDPGFGQMWHALGWADPFAGHDDFVTIGRNVGRPECTIPDCGKRWITTNQPIVLEHWPPAGPSDGPFTSIGTWRGRYDPIEYGGERYGLRVHAFRDFAPLPRLSGEAFELALDIDAVERADLALLEENGWALVDPRRAAADPWSYRDYIARSGAEFMVSKDAYVRSRSGWFSDRSICYLASGRPVVAQDTGFDGWYPTGEGLLAFNDLEEATAAVDEISGDRRRHSVAARRVAEECFDSDKVLPGLLDALGVEGA